MSQSSVLPVLLFLCLSVGTGYCKNKDLSVFIFHTSNPVVASLQVRMLKTLVSGLDEIHMFIDNSDDMNSVWKDFDGQGAHVHFFSQRESHPSKRNANVVNWYLHVLGKIILLKGQNILLLDGDVFPMTNFSAGDILQGRRLTCRRHPDGDFCWIGFIMLAPSMHSELDKFFVDPEHDRDAGGKTYNFLRAFPREFYGYTREGILQYPGLFEGAFDQDIQYIRSNFGRCDKCGAEIFFDKQFAFYHMISGSSFWRFPEGMVRLRSKIIERSLESVYLKNNTAVFETMSHSLAQIQHLPQIPPFGNFKCCR